MIRQVFKKSTLSAVNKTIQQLQNQIIMPMELSIQTHIGSSPIIEMMLNQPYRMNQPLTSIVPTPVAVGLFKE